MSESTDPDLTFQYAPTCSMPGCQQAPVAKIAAFWSYGPLRELKNYGLACEAHSEPLRALAQVRRDKLAVGDGEQVGPVEAVRLRSAGAGSAGVSP